MKIELYTSCFRTLERDITFYKLQETERGQERENSESHTKELSRNDTGN